MHKEGEAKLEPSSQVRQKLLQIQRLLQQSQRHFVPKRCPPFLLKQRALAALWKEGTTQSLWSGGYPTVTVEGGYHTVTVEGGYHTVTVEGVPHSHCAVT